jgi:regulator of sigma E protease
MGPILWKKVHKGTQYGLRLFPIGGSVMLGEDDEPSDDVNDFRNKPLWQRIIVIGAGAVLNLLLGFVLCIIINGIIINDPDPRNGIASMTVSAFREDSMSNQGESALKAGDRIVGVNGMHIISYSEISYKMDNSLIRNGVEDGYAVYKFDVIRDGEKITLPEVKFALQRDTEGELVVNERGGMT